MIRITKEPVRCPVSDDRIGMRWIDAEVEMYCSDCDFTYFYHKYDNAAYKSQKGRIKENLGYCGPGGCICRG